MLSKVTDLGCDGSGTRKNILKKREKEKERKRERDAIAAALFPKRRAVCRAEVWEREREREERERGKKVTSFPCRLLLLLFHRLFFVVVVCFAASRLVFVKRRIPLSGRKEFTREASERERERERVEEEERL